MKKALFSQHFAYNKEETINGDHDTFFYDWYTHISFKLVYVVVLLLIVLVIS